MAKVSNCRLVESEGGHCETVTETTIFGTHVVQAAASGSCHLTYNFVVQMTRGQHIATTLGFRGMSQLPTQSSPTRL